MTVAETPEVDFDIVVSEFPFVFSNGRPVNNFQKSSNVPLIFPDHVLVFVVMDSRE